jgi:hypothetical protein
MRALIAVFLLLLFSTQAFPVAALSKSYAKSQLSIMDDSGGDEDDGSSMPKGKAKKQNTLSEEDYDHSHGLSSTICPIVPVRKQMLPGHDWLYALYTGEVTTPPPNHC